MSSVLMFAANWDKWYRVLRHHKGFGVLDSTRFGLWLACGSRDLMQAGALVMTQRLLRKEKVMNYLNAVSDDAEMLSRARVSTDEQALVAQAKSGSSSAFGELYERHRRNLFRSAFRILRNREDAEDAVQRSFQRAFTALVRFREDSSFSTWMTQDRDQRSINAPAATAGTLTFANPKR